jgi:nucleoside-diphosphate-sugar epimerase
MAGLAATIFGAHGFVGRHLIQHLKRRGYEVRAVARGDETWRGHDLGHVFYAIGLTADFRSRPFETIEAHVSVLSDVLRAARFKSFVYLSSTRVYARASSTDESAPIPVQAADPDDLYNISKLMGEAACLGSGFDNVRVARLSNVFGEDLRSSNFLTAVIREAVETKAVALRTSLASEKDYVWIGDVVGALEGIALTGEEKITNVAYGANTTHGEIMDALAKATEAQITLAAGAPTVRFPRIATRRLDRLAGTARAPLVPMIGALAATFRKRTPVPRESDRYSR